MKHETLTPPQGDTLHLSLIESLAEFEQARAPWQDLEQRDPESSVFLSWDWLAQAFAANPYRWSVLCVRRGGATGAMVCILPLKYRVHWSTSRQEFQTELEPAGRLLWSEYTGFLCDPLHEQAALNAAALHLARLPWVKLSMRYVAQHRRSKIFTDALENAGFSVRYKPYLINDGETNNLLCPQVDLPEDFDSYMQGQISANRRQQYNRFKRKFLDTGEYTITCADAASFDADLDALTTFWKAKWSPEKGEAQAERGAQNYGAVLRAALATGTLFMPVLRRGDTPLGALGHVLDEKNGLVHFIIAGRDIAADEPFIGTALHFFAIEWAIRQGYICYDFCHGNEAYKYTYGAQDNEVLFFEIRRRALRDDLVFDSLCVGEALKRVEGFLKTDKPDLAAKGVAQLTRLFT
jgi:CelD/BcsL family acetyltransferase involved in cellulose biosynthesis